jgi:hypothetical protein
MKRRPPRRRIAGTFRNVPRVAAVELAEIAARLLEREREPGEEAPALRGNWGRGPGPCSQNGELVKLNAIGLTSM